MNFTCYQLILNNSIRELLLGWSVCRKQRLFYFVFGTGRKMQLERWRRG